MRGKKIQSIKRIGTFIGGLSNTVLALLLFMAVGLVGGCLDTLNSWLGTDSGSGSAPGKHHECISDRITASVDELGTLHVRDERSYSFTGSYTLSAAVLDPPDGGKAKVEGVSVIEDGVTTPLGKVKWNDDWRDEGGPADNHYAYDAEEKTIYAFSASKDVEKTFVFEYSYTNAVEVYDDAAVLYWCYIPSGWDTATKDSQLVLTLPVAEGESVDDGGNVCAFGHGDVAGTVSFAADGTVRYSVQKVARGSSAEMRVAFPASWVPLASASKTHSGQILPTISSEEQQWQDSTRSAYVSGILMVVVPLALSVLIIVLVIVLFRRFGKEHTPQFQGEYWRDVPDKRLHPTTVGRLWRWDEEDVNDLTTTLMYLSVKGVIAIECEVVAEKRLVLADKEHEVYRLIKRDPSRLDGLTKVDRLAYELVFDKVGQGRDAVTLADIQEYAQNEPESYIAALDEWQLAVSELVVREQFFEGTGQRCKTWFTYGAATLAVIDMVFCFDHANFVPFICLAPGLAALLGFSRVMPRRSREAVEVYARSKALKRWFKDFTALNEAVPTDTKVWGELFVYAYLLGVAKEVADKLDAAIPELWQDDEFAYSMLWFYNPYLATGGSVLAAGAPDFFGECFSNTLGVANSAIHGAGQLFSDGGILSDGGSFGGGGGFSGGGGGGFGGGGGGFSR